jgi:hypothetical protein
MLAVQGPRDDAYRVVTGADISDLRASPTPHSDEEIASVHLLIETDAGSGSWTEIAFHEADIQGTFHVPGHPGVVGLWLAAFTVAGTASGTFDATLYEVPDLEPDPGGFMYARGFTWKAPQGKRAYLWARSSSSTVGRPVF